MSGALVVQGDALRLPLPDESVDLCITSPPYFALRAYSTEHKAHELGSEPAPQAYLEALWAATAEMVRVLKPTGSIFVDLGDKYAGGGGGNYGDGKSVKGREGAHLTNVSNRRYWLEASGMQAKSLMLLPERYRIGCVDRLGLIARAVICWSKPNGLPESVTDRVRRSHEDWVHLTKQPRYYSAIDEVREPYESKPQRRFSPMIQGKPRGAPAGTSPQSGYAPVWDEPKQGDNPLGKPPGSVWSIPSEPLRLPDHLGVDHYAAFPSEWPRRLILAFSPHGICVDCGQGRVPVVERRAEGRDRNGAGDGGRGNRLPGYQDIDRSPWQEGVTAMILGYACSCTPFTDHPGSGERRLKTTYTPEGVTPRSEGSGTYAHWAGRYQHVGPWREYHLDRWRPAPTRPAVVLDPFMGTGTTLGVARQLGRIGIGTDLSHSYCRAARYRIFQSGDFAKATSRTWSERQGSLI